MIENRDAVLGENLRILAHVLGGICQRSTLNEAGGGEISENQLAILRMLQRRDQLTASEFARVLGISNAAVSKIVQRLVSLGMVRRGPDPDDRRRVALVLEPAGEDLLQRYEQIATRKLDHIMASFNEVEKEQLLGLIQRVVQNTLAEEQDIDAICYQCGGHCGDTCVVELRRGTCSLTDKEGH
jgi:DNA-binding MarR family transcriptional regulator